MFRDAFERMEGYRERSRDGGAATQEGSGVGRMAGLSE